GLGQNPERLASLAEALGTDRAARRQVSLELGELFALEGTQRVEVRRREPGVVVHARSTPPRAERALRSRSSPLRIRVFTVPSGSPGCAAISLCVRPSKYASSRTRRRAAGRCVTAPPRGARAPA